MNSHETANLKKKILAKYGAFSIKRANFTFLKCSFGLQIKKVSQGNLIATFAVTHEVFPQGSFTPGPILTFGGRGGWRVNS